MMEEYISQTMYDTDDCASVYTDYTEHGESGNEDELI